MIINRIWQFGVIAVLKKKILQDTDPPQTYLKNKQIEKQETQDWKQDRAVSVPRRCIMVPERELARHNGIPLFVVHL